MPGPLPAAASGSADDIERDANGMEIRRYNLSGISGAMATPMPMSAAHVAAVAGLAAAQQTQPGTPRTPAGHNPSYPVTTTVASGATGPAGITPEMFYQPEAMNAYLASLGYAQPAQPVASMAQVDTAALLAAYGQRLPAAEEETVYVNPKQYHCIMRRRAARAKAEAENKIVQARQPFLHKSRHEHALRRARQKGGQFVKSKTSSTSAMAAAAADAAAAVPPLAEQPVTSQTAQQQRAQLQQQQPHAQLLTQPAQQQQAHLPTQATRQQAQPSAPAPQPSATAEPAQSSGGATVAVQPAVPATAIAVAAVHVSRGLAACQGAEAQADASQPVGSKAVPVEHQHAPAGSIAAGAQQQTTHVTGLQMRLESAAAAGGLSTIIDS